MIPIFEPFFIGNEKKYLMDCIESGWISSQGEYILKFEEALADYHGINYAVATSSCTSALHLSLKSMGIGYGDEVICPDLTFIAPANMVILSGAKLVLVDVDAETLTIDPNLLEKNIKKRTKAIIVVHQFGHAAHMDEIMALSKKYAINVIEDNAESIGARYKGKLLGTIGDASTYSFFGNKIITSGEGGAVLTNNEETAIRCRELRDHGMNYRKKYHHIDLGYNYRMTNMQAAVGLAQIEKMDQILSLRKEQMDFYYNELEDLDGISLRKYANWCQPAHWMMTLTLDEKYSRDDFLLYMKNNGIDCRQMIFPVHQAEHFKEMFNSNTYRNSKYISKKSLHLPSSTRLKKKELYKITSIIKKYL